MADLSEIQNLNNLFLSSKNNMGEIDDLLGKEFMDRISYLMSRNNMNQAELDELLHLLTSTELKLSNLNPTERYRLGLYFIRIRAFILVAQGNYQQQKTILEHINRFDEETQLKIRKLLDDISVKLTDLTKYLVSIYLYLLRSSLSVGSRAFMRLSGSNINFKEGENNEVRD